MGINVVEKGKEGERQVARALNAALLKVLVKMQWPEEDIPRMSMVIQRNQNQSAVGGCDLNNVFGLAIEVKRQETLSIEAWWRQCVEAAGRNREFPVLCYRQNHGQWHVMMYAALSLPMINEGNQFASLPARVTVGWDVFLDWFALWVERKLMNGDYPRT